MGQAFISRRDSSGATINFNNTSVVSQFTISATSQGRRDGAAVSTDSKAIYSGGGNGSGITGYVYSIDKNFNKLSYADLTSQKKMHTGVKIGEFASFAGGRNNGSDFWTIDGYVPYSGAKVTLPDLYYARSNMAAASHGRGTGFFGGDTVNGGVYRTIDWLTHDFIHTHFDLDYPVSHAAAGAIHNKILLAGGWYSKGPTYYSNVRIFNLSGTATSGTALSIARKNLTCATIGNLYILFAGGEDANGVLRNEIDVYDSNSNKVTTKYLPVGVTSMVAMSFENCAIFLYGMTANGASSKAYIIDSSLTITTIDLGAGRTYGVAAAAGDYGFLIDGLLASGYATEIKALHVPQTITIPPGAKYKLGSMTDEVTTTTFTVYPLTTPKLSGYIAIPNITV